MAYIIKFFWSFYYGKCEFHNDETSPKHIFVIKILSAMPICYIKWDKYIINCYKVGFMVLKHLYFVIAGIEPSLANSLQRLAENDDLYISRILIFVFGLLLGILLVQIPIFNVF